jgi:hypothetical protein
LDNDFLYLFFILLGVTVCMLVDLRVKNSREKEVHARARVADKLQERFVGADQRLMVRLLLHVHCATDRRKSRRGVATKVAVLKTEMLHTANSKTLMKNIYKTKPKFI